MARGLTMPMQPGDKRNALLLLAYVPQGGHAHRRAMFRCDCGAEIEVTVNNVVTGNTKTCGGCQRERHGQTNTSLYGAWECMKHRGKTFGMDPRWATFTGFLSYPPSAGPSPIDGMEREYAPGLCLCRTNDEGGYFPENCRWDTRSNNSKEQMLVRRKNR